MQGPLTGFHHDRHNITRTAARTWSRSSYTTDPADCAMKRLPENSSGLFTRIAHNQRKISTAPQREGSDTHKVPRGLRERFHNSHCTTTRAHRATTGAIRHAQSHRLRVSATFSSRSTKYCACNEK